MTPKKTLKQRTVPTSSFQPPARADALASRESGGWNIALVVAGVLITGVTAAFALSSVMPGWEQRMFEVVNSAALPGWVSAQVAKPLSNAVWGMVGLVMVLLLIPKYRLRAWQYAMAAGSTYTAVFLLEHLVGRARPEGLGGELILRAVQDGPGFPSGHVAVLTALALTLWPFVAWPWRVLLVLLVLAEAWARVYLGVHAPLDVVGAAGVACAVVGAVHLLPVKLRAFFRIGR